jgi:hypothetical protein
MRKLLAIGMLFGLTAAPMLAAAAKNEKEADRLENAGTVMEEIMNIPDDIPQDLLDKAGSFSRPCLRLHSSSAEATAAAQWFAAAVSTSPAPGALPR